MKKTGEILRKAREEKGLSLHEIGLSLKINSKTLRAIEEGDDTRLPAKTFLRGFVLSYANFLQLDSNKVLEVFYEEVGSTKPKPYIRPQDEEKSTVDAKPAEAVEAHEETSSKGSADSLKSLREDQSPKIIGVLIVGLVLVGLIVFTKKVIDKYSKEAEVPTPEVAQTIEHATPVVPTPPPEVSPASSPSPEPLAPTSVAAPVPAPAPAPPPAEVSPPEPPPAPVAKPVELIVEALDTVEVEYSAPQGKPQKIKLSAEQVHTFKSRSGLKINFSNGGAVNLILNGKEVGIPGDLGKPIQLSY